MKKIVLIVAGLLSLLFGVMMILKISETANTCDLALEHKQQELLLKTRQAAVQIDSTLFHLQEEVLRMAAGLSKGSLTHDMILKRLERLLRKNALLFSANIAYEPYYYKSSKRLFSPLVKRKDGELIWVQVEDVYDYTDPDEKRANWYTSTLRKGAQWIDPFYGGASRNILIGFDAPFYKPGKEVSDREPAGVVSLFLSVDSLSDFMKSIDLGPSGYGAIVSAEGKYYVHPNDKYVIESKSIDQIAREKKDETRLNWWEIRQKQEVGVFEHRSTTTGLDSWFIFAPLSRLGGSLHNTFIKNDFQMDYKVVRQGKFKNVVYVFVFLLSLALFFVLLKGTTPFNMWISALVISFSLIVFIAYLWYSALAYHPQKRTGKQGILNEITRIEAVNNLLNEYKQYGSQRIYQVPTGVYLDDIDITDKGTIRLVGKVWQKISRTYPADMQQEIVFLHADVKRLQKHKVKHLKQFDLHSWDFVIEKKQKFDYRNYPLNYEQIQLQIHQSDGDYKVMPTPDILAYKLTAPSSKPGINRELVIPGWEIKESIYHLYTERLDANFGQETLLVNNFYPCISLNITIKRKFMDVFISNLTPLILVLLLLFLGLTISNVSETYQKRFKTDVPKMVTFYSGLLFVVAFAHIGIRSKVNAEGLFMLEYFYLLSYVAFLYVTVNTILFHAEVKWGGICYRDNLIYKIIFWPLMLMSILTVSYAIFY